MYGSWIIIMKSRIRIHAKKRKIPNSGSTSNNVLNEKLSTIFIFPPQVVEKVELQPLCHNGLGFAVPCA